MLFMQWCNQIMKGHDGLTQDFEFYFKHNKIRLVKKSHIDYSSEWIGSEQDCRQGDHLGDCDK